MRYLQVRRAFFVGGVFLEWGVMSAFGGKADVIQGVAECPLIANSGHSKDVPACSLIQLDRLCLGLV